MVEEPSTRAINYDPIARGYVKSLARPGGNITGIVSLQTELAATHQRPGEFSVTGEKGLFQHSRSKTEVAALRRDVCVAPVNGHRSRT